MSRAGYDVTFLARGDQLKAFRTQGLTVKSLQGDFHLDQINAVDRIGDMGTADLIILGVKSWQVQEIASELPDIMGPESLVLPLQNGVLASEELCETLPEKNVLAGLCRIISKNEVPGVIRHFALEPTIVFGELDNTKTQRLNKLKEVFEQSEIKAQMAEDIHAERWKKFISICTSGLLAVSRSTYGEIREIRETRQMMVELLKEIYELSQKVGIDIDPDFVDKNVSFIDTFPYESTASLARDVWEKKPSEIEYQNGTVVHLAQQYGVATPINNFIYNCILPMEKRARQKRDRA